MNVIHYIITLPLLIGFILLAIPEKLKPVKGIVAVITSTVAMIFSVAAFLGKTGYSFMMFNENYIGGSTLTEGIFRSINKFSAFNPDFISRMIVVMICFFSLLILVYSLVYISKRHRMYNYYAYLLITMGCSSAAVLADNLLMLCFFWGILGITIYKLIKGYDEESSFVAKKTLIMIGASDSIMLLGLAVIWKMTHVIQISQLSIPTSSVLGSTAFLCMMTGSFTKAGAFPFHTWIPEFAKKAPASSSAYLPASLDKLLGIYLMYRLCTKIFVLEQWITLMILILGVLTIISAVMMAMVQTNIKKLLGYHAVSQVGYMILGLGLGTPLGIAGGLFHMINHTLYKSGLFMVSGDIESRTGSDNIEHLGGLARAMPLTFVCALIFALSISGIPPFNGFASKWMIYQGIIDFGKHAGVASQLWVVWLALAVLGSALTLASFMKVLAGVFLGRKTEFFYEKKEVSLLMGIPVVILATACTAIGITATDWFIPEFIMPVYKTFAFTGIWDTSGVGILVLVSVALGALIYLGGNIRNYRVADNFIGGERDQEIRTVSVAEFYKTISGQNVIGWFFDKAEKKLFDIYEQLKMLVFWTSRVLSRAHTGILPFYTTWIILGVLLLLIILFQF